MIASETRDSETIIRPRIRVLNTAQIRRIHGEAQKILSTIGIRVASKKALGLFRQSAGPSSVFGDVVRIPTELVDHCLKTAPQSVKIYDRRGELAMHLPGKARFGPGVTCLYYQHPETDAIVPFARSEIRTSVRLGDALESFDFISTPAILQEKTPDAKDNAATSLEMLTALEMIANTSKPLVVLVSKSESLSSVLDLFSHLHGDLCQKPFVIPLVTPITPLVIDEGTCDRMFIAIERGLPLVYVNYGMAGVSTPMTPYGSMVQLMAEILAGITLSQIIKEGAPVIAGCLAAFMDMKSMVNFYDPMSYLMNLACAEMMAFYGIPHYGNSGNAVGWGADLISAGHQWFNHITACLGTTGMAAFVGTVLTSKVFSPNVLVYANEVIAQARLFTAGFATDESRMLLKEVSLAGPGGSFLANDLTLKHFRSAYFNSRVFPRLTMEDWEKDGHPKAETCLRKYTAEMIESLTPANDNEGLIEKGEGFIAGFAQK